MIMNAWKWADQKAGRKRVNPVHGEEEIRIILKESFIFMDEEGDTADATGEFDMQENFTL